MFHNTETDKNHKNDGDPDDQAERPFDDPYYEKYSEYGGNCQK
ncbi:MAG: hypothetical protein OYL97_22755 [Candidatus Poribacteria bacterium]|nr:hypothetical protein [Candidatus Poribacteria bacterium]